MMKPSRVVYAAILCAGALAALLGAWFVSGWADVRAQQRELAAEPERTAGRKAMELAYDLRAELQQLMTRELARPYFQYSNLFHDPRAGDNWSVAPSPLASGPDDPLVRGYFQIDALGRVTTPTINDELPELSEPKNLAANRAFRDTVVKDLSEPLRAPAIVASAVRKPPPQQRVNLTENAYIQNQTANSAWVEQNSVNPRRLPSKNPDGSVPIMISALEWRTFRFAGKPSLVAVRHVDTPDGTLVQGFVVDRSAMTSRLAERAGDAVAELKIADDATPAPEIAPGWQVAVSANPRALAEAGADAARVATKFMLRFIVVGAMAAIMFALVVMLVARAEKLARERSQFAAAAAHELRTPLAGLQLYGDMLADGLGDPNKLRDYARRMSEEASRLGRVVSNVLGFSQLERGNLSVEARPGDLGKALGELAERAQPALDRAGAVLDLDVPTELRASFDRDALARIVGNLLDNAEKYSRGADDRTIALAARELDTGVEITVSDHGPGVAVDARAKLFRPFTRGVTSDGPAGLGLGLALSRSLAQAMGGDLEYRAGGTGAAFVLKLPSA